MKKLLSISLVIVLVLTCVACTASALAENKTGLGIVTSVGSSKPVAEKDGEKTNGRAQVDSTICAVTIDENNVIISISFDVAQTRVDFAPDGTLVTDITAPVKSKRELGADYGMKETSAKNGTNGGAGFEVFEQMDNLEKYCIGKTVDEVLATPLYKRDDNHTRVGDTEELKASVTIDIGGYLDALKKAVENAK